MKAVNKLAILISMGVLTTFASAKTQEQAYLASLQAVPANLPAPLTVVSPIVSSEYEGMTVEVEFVVDVTGKPTGLNVVSPFVDNTLSLAVTEAVKQWRFKPAEVDGKAVAKKVLLPIKFVDTLPVADRLAAN